MEFTIFNEFTINLLKVILVLLIGFVTGSLLKIILMKFFDITGILNITKNNRIGKGLMDIGYSNGLLELIVDILKWTIYIIALTTTTEILGLDTISQLLKDILLFIPKLLGGIFIIIIGILLADFIGKILKESTEHKNKPHLNEINIAASEFIQLLLYLITIIMAFQIIGVNMVVIMIVFTIVLATTGLLIIIAFQDFAPNYSASIYLHSINLKKGDHIASDKFSGIINNIGRINTTIVTDHGIMRIPNRKLILHGFEKIKINENNTDQKKTDNKIDNN